MTNQELATVLAALRYWQQDLEANEAPPISEEYFADCEPLTSEEIDELCERLNCGTESQQHCPSLADSPPVTVVMQVVPCADGMEFFPDFSLVEMTPRMIGRIEALAAMCEREGLSRVALDTVVDRWADPGKYRIVGQRMEVRGGHLCFAGRPKHAGSEVETIDLPIEALKVAINGTCGSLPAGWMRDGSTLFVAEGPEALEYLQESYASEGNAPAASS